MKFTRRQIICISSLLSTTYEFIFYTLKVNMLVSIKIFRIGTMVKGQFF